MTETEKALLDLIRAAASGSPSEIPATVDPVALYRIVRSLHLSSFLFESGSRLPDSRLRSVWEQDREASVMKELTQTEEKEKIDAALSAAGIRFLYLKGTVLKRFWREPSFRYMGDMDFLYEGDDATLRRTFEGLGYTSETYGTRDFSHHFVFHKEPWFTFEPHWSLFNSDEPFAGKITGLFDRATPDPLLPGRFLISEEDLYLHCLLHAHRHLTEGGIGARSFLDFAFLLREYPDLPDRSRVREFLSKAGLLVFESRVLRVARLLSDPAATPDAEDEAELSLLFSAGLFGTLEKQVENQLQAAQSRSRFPRLRYLLKRAFPPLLSMSHRKIPAPLSWILYPFFWLRRIFVMLFSPKRRKNTRDAIRVLTSHKSDAAYGSPELRYFGLAADAGKGKGETNRE